MLAAVYAQHRTVPPGHQHLPPGYQTERSALDALFGATGGLHSYDQYADVSMLHLSGALIVLTATGTTRTGLDET